MNTALISLFLTCMILVGEVRGPFSKKDSIGSNLTVKIEMQINGIGNGYSSPLVTRDRIIVTGEIDSMGHVFAFDHDGNILWEQTYGPEWMVSYPGSRSTPIVEKDYLYLCSGRGRIVCLNIVSGEIIWSVDMIRDLNGINTTYGYSMKLLCDENKLFCSPGGRENNVTALNRFTGEVIWSSAAFKETAGYGAPIIISLPARKVLVTASEFNIFSLDASTGELLWNYPLSFKGDIPCNTPVYDGKYLYWVAGPGNGAVGVQLSNDGTSFDTVWKNRFFDTSFGSFVQIGAHLYAFSNTLRKCVSLDAETGKIQSKISFPNGSIIDWVDKLIVYSHAGDIGIIQADHGNLRLIQSFRVSGGTGEHFAHPIVNEKRLYIRHGNILQVYSLM